MITVRMADAADNKGLIGLTSVTPMNGKISIRMDRNPDFFRMLQIRGSSTTCIAENDREIIGCLSVVEMPCYILGEESKVLYLCDLKVHPAYRNGRVAYRMIRIMTERWLKENDLLMYTNVAYGNLEVMPFFKGRAGLPSFSSPGQISVFQLLPSRKGSTPGKYRIVETYDIQLLLDAYERRKRSYRLCFIPKPELLEDCTNLLALDASGVLRGCLSLFDPGRARQNVLMRLPFFLRIFVGALRGLNRIYPFINLPGYGEAMRILYVAHFYNEAGHEDALGCLIDHARMLAFRDGYVFLSVALHQQDPANRIVKKYRKFTFRSIALIAGSTKKILNSITAPDSIIYEDFSLV